MSGSQQHTVMTVMALGWRVEAYRTWANIERLLNARAGVVKKGQQRVITLPLNTSAVWLGEDCFDLIRFEIAWCGYWGLLGRNAQHSGTLRGGRRLSFSHEGEDRWRRRLRLFRAVELLESGMAITGVAMELGYGSTSAFTYAFRIEIKHSPTAYVRAGDAYFEPD
ncbi:helix-turn-helix domain-containing protein [Pollutimonas sp. H1-120]|uniref:helix-turn-helix domain-containing protein n=1 Tax=Pollutimonas sp. H1-120 TaxID=3148824 RepID=UPI003B523420